MSAMVFVLHEQVSDQYGTDRVVGVFSSAEIAWRSAHERNTRCLVMAYFLDRPEMKGCLVPDPKVSEANFRRAVETPLTGTWQGFVDAVHSVAPDANAIEDKARFVVTIYAEANKHEAIREAIWPAMNPCTLVEFVATGVKA